MSVRQVVRIVRHGSTQKRLHEQHELRQHKSHELLQLLAALCRANCVIDVLQHVSMMQWAPT